MTETFRFEIAEKLIECIGTTDEVREYFIEYISVRSDKPDLVITVTEKMIQEQKERFNKYNPNTSGLTDFDYVIAGIYDEMLCYLLNYDVTMFHGSVVAVDDEAFMFTAKSGTGKSTHRSFWQKLLGDKVTVVNDDKPLILCNENTSYVYGAPLSGKERIHTNCKVKLKGICILERGLSNSIEKISSEDVLPYFMPRVRLYKNPVLDKLVLNCVDKLLKSVDFYVMKCLPNVEAAKMSYEFMKTK